MAVSGAMLALPGPAFPQLDVFSADGVPIGLGNDRLRLVHADAKKQDADGKEEALEGSRASTHEVQTAGSVWDGSVVLAMLLQHHVERGGLDALRYLWVLLNKMEWRRREKNERKREETRGDERKREETRGDVMSGGETSGEDRRRKRQRRHRQTHRHRQGKRRNGRHQETQSHISV